MRRATVLFAAAALLLAGGCRERDIDFGGDDAGDAAVEGDSDTEPCPYLCMTVNLCQASGGSVEDGYACAVSEEVCCSFPCEHQCMSQEMCQLSGGTVVGFSICPDPDDVCCD